MKCVKCTEAVHKNLLEVHQMADYCMELKADHVKCPLCHGDVDGLKHHLILDCPGTAKRRSRI